jgi:hypothetical protein
MLIGTLKTLLWMDSEWMSHFSIKIMIRATGTEANINDLMIRSTFKPQKHPTKTRRKNKRRINSSRAMEFELVDNELRSY